MSPAVAPAVLHLFLSSGVTASVALEETCDTCQGAGVLPSEAWQEWFRRFNAEVDRLRRVAPALGMIPREDRAEAVAGTEPDEPEEIMCGDCEGAGVNPTRAGMAILTLVGRSRT